LSLLVDFAYLDRLKSIGPD